MIFLSPLFDTESVVPTGKQTKGQEASPVDNTDHVQVPPYRDTDAQPLPLPRRGR